MVLIVAEGWLPGFLWWKILPRAAFRGLKSENLYVVLGVFDNKALVGLKKFIVESYKQVFFKLACLLYSGLCGIVGVCLSRAGIDRKNLYCIEIVFFRRFALRGFVG